MLIRTVVILSLQHKLKQNKTPTQAFTPPADEKKMSTIWIFGSNLGITAQAGAETDISWS